MPDSRMFVLVIFIAVFSTSAFVLNDLDVEEDRLKEHWRNPVAFGRLTWRAALLGFVGLACISIVSLFALGTSLLPEGMMVIALCWGYSWRPRFKVLPVAAAIVHGAVPELYLVIGYLLYRPLTYAAVLIAGISFTLAMMTEVIQELRDVEADKNFRRTSAIIFGNPGTANLSIGLMTADVVMYWLLILDGFLSPLFAFFVPLVYFLYEPLVMLRKGSLDPTGAISKLRNRGLAFSSLLVAAYLLL
jgi:4-hydroxybenzoate polyprenyltransferase